MSPVPRLPGTANQDLVSQRIGAYCLTRLIGHGGMGMVYAAVRDDDQYYKQVALKVVKRGPDSDLVLGRFRHERQILARLDHPYVARLVDGGTTEDGLPYFVMEYVEGEAITRYCETAKLTIRERLKLFRAVCEAVQYAHQNLVIHRDLKPGNILVTKDGVPKLLDFGIAKFLDPDLPPGAPPRTATVMRMMTPGYASPEQALGLTVTTATDVYSLGAVLYEMLTGERARRFKNSSPSEIERVICEVETEKPSAAVARNPEAPARLRRQLAGDLDSVVLMAMRKEPGRRYRSVEQFSEDIGRHLEGRPVLARQGALAYRAGKSIRRHKLALAAAALVMLSLGGGMVATAYQARRAGRRFAQVRKMANTFLFDFHDKVLALPGSTEAREMVVKTALEYLDNLAQEAGGDPSLKSELAQAYLRVGDVQGNQRSANLGHPGAARESYRKALTLAQALAARGGDDPQDLWILTRSYIRLGDHQVLTGDMAGGVELLRQGLRTAEAVYTRHPGEERYLVELIGGHERLGDAELSASDGASALRSYRRVLQLCERRAVQFPSDQAQHTLALSHSRLGDALAAQGDLIATMESYHQSLTIRKALARSQPSNPIYRRELKTVYNWMGNYSGHPMFINLGDQATALDYYRQGLVISEELAAADPKNAFARLDLAISYGKMGDIVSDADPKQGAEFYRKALTLTRGLLELRPGEFGYLRRQAGFLRNLATPLGKLGDRRGSLQSLRLALETLQILSVKNPTSAEVRADLYTTLNALGDLALETRDFGGASENYRQALAIAETSSAANPSDLHALWRLADSYSRFGALDAARASEPGGPAAGRVARWREARAWYQKSLDVWDRWYQHAASSAFNTSRRDRAARALAQCGQALAKLNRSATP